MIGIIDYGSGNVQAFHDIYRKANISSKISSKPEDLNDVDKLIIPGVGAFDATLQLFQNSGLKDKLDYLVLEKKIPVLGICVGMQIMANSSEEGTLEGLGWIPGMVKQIPINKLQHKPFLPHMGWNTVEETTHPIFDNIDVQKGFYFVHSYYYECVDEANIIGTTQYGEKFISAIANKHIFGTQFHPEKSHANGVTLLKNFAEL